MVLDRLLKANRSSRGDFVVIWVMVAVFAAIPIVAAVRQSPWWLLALLSAIIWIQALRIRFTGPAPEERLRRFRSAQPPCGAG